ncbi:hypothetical protein [Streptomonospora litoralis]|uniref:Uncharacterized protein n=1 Tax=Streptomonospora litoralis TaxID=2498135 RepID=A0A4P6QAQ7_9ACTN|nr:hypothetical protein [Streptomonospora litoralis]QBI56851.1 hypothetical protein EKD16_25555 [Streptomonospora litoralis]
MTRHREDEDADLRRRVADILRAAPPDADPDVTASEIVYIARCRGYRKTAAARADDEWRTNGRNEPSHPDRVRDFVSRIRADLQNHRPDTEEGNR